GVNRNTHTIAASVRCAATRTNPSSHSIDSACSSSSAYLGRLAAVSGVGHACSPIIAGKLEVRTWVGFQA
ncbi:MAG: hypothetical protein ACPIOQ_15565, partial [Promethearchaeia archaeon]